MTERRDESDSLQRLFTLVYELGSEALSKSRKTPGGAQAFAKTQILLQSMTVFSQKGLETTTVQDLLDAAQISRRTFYKYFTSKIDVLESIYELSLKVIMARCDEELAASTCLDDFIERLAAIYFDYQLAVGRIIGLMIEEALRSESPLAPHRLSAHKSIVGILQRELSRLGGKGIDPMMINTLLWAIEGTTLHLFNATDCGKEDVQRARAIIGQLIRSSLAVYFESC